MKNALLFGVMALALTGSWELSMVNDQTAPRPVAAFLLAADGEEEEFTVDIKQEEIEGPDLTWNVQLG